MKAVLDASYSSVMYTGGLGTAMIPKVMVVMVMMMMMMMIMMMVMMMMVLTIHVQVLSNMLCGLQVCAMAEAMLIGNRV